MSLKKMALGALFGAGLATLAPVNAAHADCGDVTLTEMNWASSLVVTQVAKFLMEQGYGCNVSTLPSSGGPALTSIAENDTPDIATEMWVNSLPAYPDMEKEGKVITATHVLSDGAQEGFWVPTYLVEKHPELATIEGIVANPQLIGNRFHNCPEGWRCRKVNAALAKLHGFDGAGIEVFTHGSGETLATSIASAYTSEEPWFGYYWAPTSILGKYPMVRVDLGPVNQEAYDCLSAADICENPQKTQYPSAEVITAVTNSFGEREPEILALMQKMAFTNDIMNAVLAWQDANKASAEEAAVHYLTSYPEIWSGWLNDEARAKLQALLGTS